MGVLGGLGVVFWGIQRILRKFFLDFGVFLGEFEEVLEIWENLGFFGDFLEGV